MSVAIRRDGDTLVADLSGEWNLDRNVPAFSALADAAVAAGASAENVPDLQAIKVDGSALVAWDSSLLVFLRQGQDYSASHKLDWKTDGIPDRITKLLALAHLVPERVTAVDKPRASPIARLGTAALSTWDSGHAAITFAGNVGLGLAGLATRRVRMRWREFWVVVQSNASGALPIVTLIALLTGVVIAFLGVVVLQRFGAGYYSSYLVGYGMLREMGALMTGIIIAGRTGAGFAAELGSMKITEEIDAYRALGISPIEHLVLPRVLGIFVMMPLLVIYADFVGIAGGMGIAVAMLDLSMEQFRSGLFTAVELSDALLGMFKATVFGAVIGFAGCMKGLQAGSDAGSVGRAATSAVVLAITLIVLANAVIDWLAALLQV